MKFLQITIENFLAIGEAKVKLADRGLVLVQGINEDDTSADSNGAGKSSLADALCWALYGETARGISGDDVVNTSAGKNTRVQVDIEDGDDVFRIARHRKHKTGKNGAQVMRLAKDGTITDLTLGTDRLTQEVIARVIGCSLDVFYASIYAGQEQMPDLPGMTDKQLKLLVEEAAGVTILEQAYKEANARLAATKAEAETFGRKLEAEETRLGDARNRHAELILAEEEFETRRKATVAELATRARAYKGEAEIIIKTLAGMTPRAEIDAALADCETKIAAVDGEQKRLRTLDLEVTRATSRQAAAQSTMTAAHERATAARKAIEAIDHQIGCPCSECARPLTADEIAPAKAAATQRFKDLAEAYKRAKSDADDAASALQSVTDERDAFAATMTDLSAINAQRASLSAQRAAIVEKETERDRHLETSRRFAEQAVAKRDEPNPFVAQREKCLAACDTLAAGIDKLKADQVALDQRMKTAEVIAKIFSPSGVRAHILDDVTPFLNDQTAKYLSTLSDGNISATWTTLVKTAKGELREKFSIEVVKDKAAQSFKGLSGGEKRKVRIAAALALQDLVARRATKPIDLFIGDEIDNALDSAGLERLCVVLEEKARERGTVLVVSHADLKDWISQVVLFRIKDGRSVVEEMVS